MRLISAVLGTESMRAREDANAALLNYGFNFFETKRLYAAGEPLTTAPVWKGATRTVGLALQRDLYVTGQRGQVGNVRAEFELPDQLLAPLAVDQPIGKASIVVDGATIATHDLYPSEAVPAGGLFRRATDTVRLWLH
jgi:D-alanyl-D-alanine carboxypeptidase (penicillin-binding protein 5/6)